MVRLLNNNGYHLMAGKQVSRYALAVGLALAGLGSNPASAQQKASTATASAETGGMLEEIVVSARRRDEKLTDVPVSITAFSSDFLEKQNIQSFTDYATKIPNLTFQYGQGSDVSSVGFSGGRQTTIRGVVGAETTAYYMNDTPVPSTVSPQALGLDRIEVLKGPQGTLFGASSMGGNVRFITKKPSLSDQHSSAQVQVGGTNGGGPDAGINALTNVVLTPDKLALNVALNAQRESGFIKRAFPDANGQPFVKDGQGRNDSLSGTVTLRAALTEKLEATVTGMGDISKLHGFPAAYLPLPGFKPVSYTLNRDHDVQEYSRNRWGIGSVVLNYEGEGFAVTSSTSIFARKVQELEDGTEGTNQYFKRELGADLGNPALYVISINKEERYTHESRISFDDGTLLPNLSGVAGFFYQRKDQTFRQPAIRVPELLKAGFPQDYQNEVTIPKHEDNVAVFGELYYDIVPKLTLTLGLRHYWITQRVEENLSTGMVNPPEGAFVPELKNFQAGFVPKAVISYKMTDEGTVYASASKGFRVGGAQAPLPTFCANDLAAIGVSQSQSQRYSPDTVWSYEVGAKDRVAGGRLNVSAAAFQIDWTDVQQAVPLPGCSLSFTTNAGKARIRGGELEVSGRPFTGIPFTLQVGLGYTDAVLQDPGLVPLAPDSRLAQVPRWTGTVSGYYETPVSTETDLFMSADYSYTGTVPVPNLDGNGFLNRPAFNLVNASIGLRFDNATLSLYGKNLLDKRLNFGNLYPSAFLRREMLSGGGFRYLPVGAVSRPLQIGVQYKVEF